MNLLLLKNEIIKKLLLLLLINFKQFNNMHKSMFFFCFRLIIEINNKLIFFNGSKPRLEINVARCQI